MKEYNRIYQYPNHYYLWEKFIRIYLALNNISIREQELVILVYFCMYGINKNTYKLLLTNKIVPKQQTIDNAKTSLYRNKLINKIASKRWELSKVFSSLQIDNKEGEEIIIRIRCQIKSL